MEQNIPQTNTPPSRTRKIVSIVSIVTFVLLLVLITVFVGKPLISTLKDPAAFRAWIDARGFWGKLAFIGMCILQVVVAFIPGEPFELAAGYAFGALEGTLLVWFGLALGSTIVFLCVRKFGVKLVEAVFPREKIDALPLLNNEKALNATAFILFFIPGTPKDLLTYAAGLTKIKILPWVLLTSVARLPSIITSTVSGSALGTKQYVLAAVVFGLTALLSGAGFIIYRAAEKKRALREAGDRIAAQTLFVPKDESAERQTNDSGNNG
ncbi:MAG TPA: TVP38/TMEM64 family protein [Candidatus Cryosericum sp.]|nr:TVP38/TMEM64 family protein [Candidatus Cryosericum sp.]